MISFLPLVKDDDSKSSKGKVVSAFENSQSESFFENLRVFLRKWRVILGKWRVFFEKWRVILRKLRVF